MKKLFLILPTLLFFILPYVASAALSDTVVDQSQLFDNATVQFGWNDAGGKRGVCQSFKPTQNNTNGILVLMSKASGSLVCDKGVQILVMDNSHGCDPAWAPGNQLGQLTLTHDECIAKISTTTPAYVNFEFSTPINLTANTTTWFEIRHTGTFTSNEMNIRVYPENYANGKFGWHNNNGSNEDATRDMFFIESYFNGLTTTTTAQVSILDPINGASFTPTEINSHDFKVVSSYPNTNTPVYFQFLLYSSASSTVPIFSGQVHPSNDTDGGLPSWHGSLGYVFNVDTYKVQARALYSSIGYVTPWSAITNFTVASSTLQLNQICALTDLTCMVTNGLSWAFVPDPQVMSDFSSSTIALLKQHIPFSYFYELQTLIGSQSAASTTLDLDFTLTVPGSNATFTMPFLHTSDTTVNNFLDRIRPFEIAGLWVLFAVYLLERISDLQL